MLKKRIIVLATGLALVVAVAAASTGVANSLVSLTMPTPQVVACNAGGGSGGGC
jgi:hypothetical protein